MEHEVKGQRDRRKKVTSVTNAPESEAPSTSQESVLREEPAQPVPSKEIGDDHTVKGQRERKKKTAAETAQAEVAGGGSAPVPAAVEDGDKGQQATAPASSASPSQQEIGDDHTVKGQRERKKKTAAETAQAEVAGGGSAPVPAAVEGGDKGQQATAPASSASPSQQGSPNNKPAVSKADPKPKPKPTPKAIATPTKPTVPKPASPEPHVPAPAPAIKSTTSPTPAVPSNVTVTHVVVKPPSTTAGSAVATGNKSGKTITMHIPDISSLDPDYESDRMRHNFRMQSTSVCAAADVSQRAAGQTSYGVDKGCAVFAVKVVQCGEFAVGWGAVDAHMILGSTLTSFGLNSDGTKCNSGKTEAYTEALAQGDVITAMIHLQGGMVGFQKNSKDLGLAFRLPKDLQGVPFFPHVMVKNAILSIHWAPDKANGVTPTLFKGFAWLSDHPTLVSRYEAWKTMQRLKLERPVLDIKEQPKLPTNTTPAPTTSTPATTPAPAPGAATTSAPAPVAAATSTPPVEPIPIITTSEISIPKVLPGSKNSSATAVSKPNSHSQPFIPFWVKEEVTTTSPGPTAAASPAEPSIQQPKLQAPPKPSAMSPQDYAVECLRRKEHKYSEKSKNMPSYFMREEVVRAVAENKVTVISGGTGCGKTTLIPQFLLDANLVPADHQIVVTQPRRISAITIPEYISTERREPLGGETGFQIRFVNMTSSETRIVFVTTAILLRRLHTDPTLSSAGILIVDEVHERDIYSEFLLLLVRELLLKDKTPLKLVLMSATLSANDFAEYFKGLQTDKTSNIKVIDIPGRLFPITEYYLEDALEWTAFRIQKFGKGSGKGKGKGKGKGRGKGKGNDDDEPAAPEEPSEEDVQDVQLQLACKEETYSDMVIRSLALWSERDIHIDLIKQLVYRFHAEGPGAILIFLPGWGDIAKCHAALQDPDFYLLTLHSMMSAEEQHKAFEPPPSGKRKVILSTNIAETSVTIDDVVYVIDSGVMKERVYEADNDYSVLYTSLVTKANATQRRGRAGRCQAGTVVHLFPSYMLKQMRDFPTPEMLSTSLEEVILQLKVVSGGDVKATLASSMAQPSDKAMENAIFILQRLHALTDKKELTLLGRALAALPVSPIVAKMILYGGLFRVIKPVSVIAAFLSLKSPFVQSVDGNEDRGKKDFDDNSYSDHYCLIQAYAGWRDAVKKGEGQAFCQRHNLSEETMELGRLMVEQFVSFSVHSGYDGSDVNADDESSYCEVDPLSVKSKTWVLTKAAFVCGHWPNVVGAYVDRNRIVWWNDAAVELLPFRSSVCSFQDTLPGQWLVFSDSMKMGRLNTMENTCVHTGYLLLCCTVLKWQNNEVWMDWWQGTLPQLSHQKVFELRTNLHDGLKKVLEGRQLSMFPMSVRDAILNFLNVDQIHLQGLTPTASQPSVLAKIHKYLWDSVEGQ